MSPFEVGELIQFEITMDLSHGWDTSQCKFYIQHVGASTHYDGTAWANLPLMTNKNVSCDSDDDCTFSWDEIKQEGKNYIYISVPEPYSGFYSFWDEKIKIKHLGGLSDAAIAGIVLGCCAFVGIIAAIIGCCCCKYNPRCYTCCQRCCPCCHCCLCLLCSLCCHTPVIRL